MVGEVLKQLDDNRFIVKAANGPRWVVGCRRRVDPAKLKSGTRVALDMTTMTIMRPLPREVDPTVYQMVRGCLSGETNPLAEPSAYFAPVIDCISPLLLLSWQLSEDPGQISFSAVGGLTEQIRELREVVELPLTNPELFVRVGIKPPKGVLLYGPPGTGKTLLARALACNLNASFLKVVASAIVDKYIGESARIVREMFSYAKAHEPCVIFIDEIDAIGGRRFSDGSSADREIQRTLMEVC